MIFIYSGHTDTSSYSYLFVLIEKLRIINCFMNSMKNAWFGVNVASFVGILGEKIKAVYKLTFTYLYVGSHEPD